MRRVWLRHLFTFAAGLSLLLCIAVCVMWVRSHWAYSRWDTFRRTTSTIRSGGVPGQTVDCYRDDMITLAAGGIRLHLCSGERPVQPGRRPGDWSRSERLISAGSTYPLIVYRPPGVKLQWTRGGFQILVSDYRGLNTVGATIMHSERSLTLPMWFLALATAVLPALWLRSTRLRRRRAGAAGLCPTCGYDLRASPERCPECGTLRQSSAQVAVKA